MWFLFDSCSIGYLCVYVAIQKLIFLPHLVIDFTTAYVLGSMLERAGEAVNVNERARTGGVQNGAERATAVKVRQPALRGKQV